MSTSTIHSMIRLSSSLSRGTHFIAEEDIGIGSLVLQPTCIVEALKTNDYCDGCKLRIQDDSWLCVLCNGVALCDACQPILKDRHSVECRAINFLDLQIEEGGTTPSNAAVVSSTPRENLLLCLRYAIHADASYMGNDLWFKTMWNNGTVPEKLLTHQDQRSDVLLEQLNTTAKFIVDTSTEFSVCLVTFEQVLQFLQIARVNAHGIMDPLLQETIGVGFYPSASCLNHSCIPNVDFLPNGIGRLTFVAIRNIRAGEELTITYTDIITQSSKERQETLREDYFFTCTCERCISSFRYDTKLSSGTTSSCDMVGAIHQDAESSDTIELGLKRFKQAVEKKVHLPNIHKLQWKSQHGVLIHAQELNQSKSVFMAANEMLLFFKELEEDVGYSLPVAQVGLNLMKAKAATNLNIKYHEEGIGCLASAIEALQAFQIDTAGLRAWAENFPIVYDETSIHEIAYIDQ